MQKFKVKLASVTNYRKLILLQPRFQGGVIHCAASCLSFEIGDFEQRFPPLDHGPSQALDVDKKTFKLEKNYVF